MGTGRIQGPAGLSRRILLYVQIRMRRSCKARSNTLWITLIKQVISLGDVLVVVSLLLALRFVNRVPATVLFCVLQCAPSTSSSSPFLFCRSRVFRPDRFEGSGVSMEHAGINVAGVGPAAAAADAAADTGC